MTTTSTTDFELDFTEIAEEAWERAGKELRTGYQLRTARRSMNLMLIEWQNRGVNLWTLDEGTLPLVAGTASYTLPADTVDLLEHTLRKNAGNASTQTDINMTRISVSRYNAIPNKLTQGEPRQIFILRERDAPSVTFWPVPSDNNGVLLYWRMRRIQDAGDGVETPDLPFRFLPCLTAGLAYHISMKVPELMSRTQMLKAVYDEQFRMAENEDRDRTTFRLVPGMRRA